MRLRLAMLIGGLALALGAPAFAQDSKISNVLHRPLAAGPAAFLAAARKPPKAGACEVLSPDPGFREEMLLDVSSIGSPGGRKYERRVALVVGNGAYTAISPLRNPPNDASSMAKMFRALGFTVYRAVDATEKSLDDCFAKFKGDLEASDAQGAKADIALFFYAGHGVQLTSTEDNEKRNYMLSVDASVDPATGKAKGFRQVDRVLTEMRAHSKQAVFLYDACRNAPYGEGVVKEADDQSVRAFDASGAAPIAEESERASQAGLFIAYATSPGKTADDAWGPQGSAHSPFTEALLKNLPQAGAILEEALARSYYAVGQLTAGRQTPWTSSSLQEPVLLNGATRAADLQIKSSELAARGGKFRIEGLKGPAIAEALKGLPSRWIDDDVGAQRFSAARVELFSAHDSAEVRFIGHKWGVNDAAFSSDGVRVVTASEDASTKIWDARSGTLLRNLESSDLLRGDIRGAVFSPDGSRVATAVDSTYSSSVILWDTASGERLAPLMHPEPVLAVAYSRDGARLATASRDWKVRIWNPRIGKLLETLEIRTGPNSVAFSPNGALLVVGTNRSQAELRHAAGGALQRTLSGHAGPVTRAFFTPNGMQVVTASEDGTARLWDAATGAVIITFQGHERKVTDADVSADGKRLVTISDDRTVKLWDMESGKVLRSVPASGVSVAFSPDGIQILTALADRTAKISTAEPGPAMKFEESACACAAVTADGSRVAAADWDPGAKKTVVRVWNAKTGAPMRSLAPTHGVIGHIAFSPDGSRVAAGVIDYDLSVSSDAKASAQIWDLRSGALVETLAGHTDDITSVAFDAGGERLATASEDDSAIVWNLKTDAPFRSFSSPKWMMNAEFSPDGKFLLTASLDGTATIWDIASGSAVEVLSGHLDYLKDATFSPDGQTIATASADRTVNLWRFNDAPVYGRNWSKTITLEHEDIVYAAAFSPDGRRIATAAALSGVKLWDPRNGALLKTVEGYDHVGFGADSRTVLAVSGGAPVLHDAGLYGPELLNAAYALLTDEQRAEVERERIRYWEVDPKLLQ